MLETARDRAEQVLHTLQQKSRAFMDAEAGLMKSIKEAVEDMGHAPDEIRERLEALLGSVRTQKVWERFMSSQPVVKLSDFRDDIEQQVQLQLKNILKASPLATQEDINKIAKQIKTLQRKVNDLKKSCEAS